ncbi:MAG: hypothetical protein ABW049_11705 [Spongiibacteraceae bacterium]
MTDAVNDALMTGAVWDQFCDQLKAAGRLIVDNEFSSDPIDKAEGYRYLTRLLRYGFEVALEFSDPDFPVFYAPSHETLKIMADNPDTLHFMAAIRGDRDYVIRGKRGSVNRIVFTSLSRAGEAGGLALDHGIDTSKLQVDANGNFELIVSRNRHEGNWLALNDNSIQILVRAIFLDRRAETAPEISIAPLADSGAPQALTAQKISQTLQGAAAVMAGTATHVTRVVQAVRANGWINKIGEDPKLVAAGDPSARYFQGLWELRDEEALVVDIEIPECFFWNFQVNNCWMESLDYRYQRIHVNKASAEVNDGRVRIIVAHTDPGLPNWLTTDGHARGTLMSRWIDAKSPPKIVTRVVKFDALSHL